MSRLHPCLQRRRFLRTHTYAAYTGKNSTGRAGIAHPIPGETKRYHVNAQPRACFFTHRTLLLSNSRIFGQAWGKKLVNEGPEGFARTVFAGLPSDIDACRKQSALRHLFWHCHAWHTEQGPDGFVSDILNAGTHWQDALQKQKANITYIVGDGDRTVVDRPFQELVKRTGGEVLTIKNTGLSLLHSAPEAWVEHLLH